MSKLQLKKLRSKIKKRVPTNLSKTNFRGKQPQVHERSVNFRSGKILNAVVDAARLTR